MECGETYKVAGQVLIHQCEGKGKQTKSFFYCIKTCLPGWLGDFVASTAVLKPVQGQFLTSVQSLLIIYDINEYN